MRAFALLMLTGPPAISALVFGAPHSASAKPYEIKVPYEQIGFDGPDMFQPTKKTTYFVWVDLDGFSKDEARMDVFVIASTLCSRKRRCSVHYWTDRERAARSLPMSDAQYEAIIASYDVKAMYHYDGRIFEIEESYCHPFREPEERCRWE